MEVGASREESVSNYCFGLWFGIIRVRPVRAAAARRIPRRSTDTADRLGLGALRGYAGSTPSALPVGESAATPDSAQYDEAGCRLIRRRRYFPSTRESGRL